MLSPQREMEMIMKVKATRSSEASAAALALLLAACSGTPTVEVRPRHVGSGPAAGTTDATESSGPPTSVLCSVGDADSGPEYYRFEPMNRKLKYYPDFAAAIGIAQVSDCDSARRYAGGYFDYVRAHPGFDSGQPLEYPYEPLPSRPSGPAGTLEVAKILNGIGTINLPVVELSFTNTVATNPTIADQYFNFHGSSCTGTFISKNVILTAAHCIAKAAVQSCIENNIAVTSCHPKWFNYHQWSIHFSNFDLTNVWALSDVHPDWFGLGFDPTKPFPASDTPGFPSDDPSLPPIEQSTYDALVGAQHDVALIYIDDDSILPFDVEQDGAKRLALLPPALASDGTLTGPLAFYGWGAHPASDNTMRKSMQMPALKLNDEAINGRTLTDSSDSIVCHGDSGGPLVRTVNVHTNGGDDQTVEAVLAVTSTGPRAPTKSECPDPSTVQKGNNAMNWSRVDTPSAQNFITRFIDRFYGPYFRCKQRPTTDGPQGTMAVEECWGFPCDDADGCKDQPQGYYCSNPGGDLVETHSECATCAGQGGGCDCVVGQCLPGPGALPPPDLPDAP